MDHDRRRGDDSGRIEFDQLSELSMWIVQLSNATEDDVKTLVETLDSTIYYAS
jgi:hypothetical protein